MNKTRKAAMALVVAIPFGVVMLLDPKEAVDNPHTDQEAPVVPMLDSQAPIISTFTGTAATFSHRADIYISPNVPV